MQWPQQVVLIRHARSAYNSTKQQMLFDRDYSLFQECFARNPIDPEASRLAVTLNKRYPSTGADWSTPLANGGWEDSVRLGQHLQSACHIPDVLFISPYVRTWATLSGIFEGWPEIADVPVIEDERIREQEFGQRLECIDRDIFLALNPNQQRLYAAQGPYWYRWPQGENIADVRSRMRSWAITLHNRFAGQSVMAITHHIAILAWRANINNLSPTEYLSLEQQALPANGSVSRYVSDFSFNQERLVLAQHAFVPKTS